MPGVLPSQSVSVSYTLPVTLREPLSNAKPAVNRINRHLTEESLARLIHEHFCYNPDPLRLCVKHRP